MDAIAKDVAAVARLHVVEKILDVVCQTTGIGFAAIARVTADRWVACAVRDRIDFGLTPGGELEVLTTLCKEVGECGRTIVIDNVAEDPVFRDHPTPRQYGFQSYISTPIHVRGDFFGTLCAIDPRPTKLSEAGTVAMFELFAELIARHIESDAQLERGRALIELSDRFRDLDDPADLAYAAAEILGRTLDLSRSGYGTIDPQAETAHVERDWNAPGIASIAGVHRFRNYGSFIDDLKRGDTVVIVDTDADRRTAATTAAMKAIGAQAIVNIPVVEQGALVALLYLHQAGPRQWSDDELDFTREVADRTRMAIERRRAERDLRELTASLEQQVADRTAERDRVWRNSRDLLVVVGADGIFRAINPAWAAILGHKPSEVIGRSFLDFVWPEDAQRTQGGLDTAVAAADLSHFENRYSHKDGTPRWISWHTSAEGDLVYAYGRDVTAERERQTELQQAQEALRQSQKLEALGQLTGGVAHDFNNLLTPIIGGLDMLKRGSGDDARLKRISSGALESAERARTLVQRLLAFGRRQTLTSKPVDMSQLVHGALDLIRHAVGHGVRVEVANLAGCVAIGDAAQLELALLNLCVNARDAMPDGGALRIAVDRATIRRSQNGLAAGDYVKLSVADQGVGMDAATLAKAIDPFFTTKGVGHGTGLGLSMVHGLCAQFGGGLTLRSKVGEGTTAEMWLPAVDAVAVTTAPADRLVPAPPPKGEGRAVLLIDDEELVRMSVAETLREVGYRVVEAASAAGALAKLEAGAAPDVVVTDHIMPGMSGAALAAEIRRRWPGLPVLMITGYANLRPDETKGLEVLAKPFKQEELAERVATLVARGMGENVVLLAR